MAARSGHAPRPRHVPQRTCVACREGKAKRDLIRIVRTVSGAVVVDPDGKLSGRGAYLCHSQTCWSAGLQRSVLARALKIDQLSEDDARALAQVASALPSEDSAEVR